MRRRTTHLKRRLFNLAAAVSMALCVATAVLWVRSYSISDTVGRVGQVKVMCIDSLVGSLNLAVTGADPENEEPGPRPYYFYNRGNCRGSLGVWAGGKRVRFGGRIDTKSGFGWMVVPHWIAALLLSALPLWWARVYQRVRRWASQGRCARCGYDLRATPERCPECGALPEAPPAAAA
jgi:hypothetical protein